jgi:hypothetical protein
LKKKNKLLNQDLTLNKPQIPPLPKTSNNPPIEPTKEKVCPLHKEIPPIEKIDLLVMKERSKDFKI